MAKKSRTLSSKRSKLVTWVAGVAALAMVGTIAVVVAGYDARETPREDPSVWAMRSTGQYARVNSLTAEIDTVRAVDDPSGLVQSGTQSLVLTHGNGRAWTIDPTLPQDLKDDAGGEQVSQIDGENADASGDTPSNTDQAGATSDDAGVVTTASSEEDAAAAELDSSAQASSMPGGTRDVILAGDQLLVRTESGDAYIGVLGDTSVSSAAGDDAETTTALQFTLIDPFAGGEEDGGEEDGAEEDADEASKFIADAAAIDAEGRVALMSTSAHELRWYSTKRAEFTGVEQLPEEITAEDLQLAIVDGEWVALNGADLWRSGSKSPVTLALDATPKLQASSLRGDGVGVLIADGDGLWRVVGDEPENIAKLSGVPAQPISVAGEQFAAWVGQDQASLWKSDADREGELASLDVDDSVTIPGDPEPVFRSNGGTALLTEVKTGMLWTVPEGRMIPVEQWTLADPPKERDGTVVVADVTEQEPPVAVDDAFGVRASEPALLPVLLNDYDPNRKDVLTVIPEGMGDGLDPKFGAVAATTDAQSLVFTPAKNATGSAQFSYRITDGENVSEAATVTLTVAAEDVNTAPEWCGVEGCQQQWPSPEITPGGTLVLPILDGWVDPEGDPMMLESATAVGADDPVRALVTDDGRLAVRHLDANAPASDATVRVTVTDARGALTTRDIVLQVRDDAQAELGAMATTVEVGQTVTVRPLTRVVGGSGSYVLVDANVQSGTARVTTAAGGTVSIAASQAGQTLVTLTVRDSDTQEELSGLLRITAVPSHTKLAIEPMSAFVRPLADTTVDVLNVVPSANSRALVVQDATVVEGELRADVIEYANVRVSGSTVDGAPGRIGSVDVTVAEGTDEAVGRLTVFQVAEQGETGAIAVPDNATVRAGEVVDIPVLDNDVSAPGQRLVLHPEIGGSGAKGELAFASGNTLRYLAPKEPGNYTLTYTTYGASAPESSDVGQVHVTVVSREGNRDPVPRALTVRLAPGESGSVQVPLSSVDSDGDRVRLVSVDAPDDAQLTATVSMRSSQIKVEASSNAKPGMQTVNYTVRDEFGGVGQGIVRIIVTAASAASSAPITYSDYVRMVAGAAETAVVYPLENDLDPSGGKLSLVEVTPNVPGGKDSAEYRALSARIDTSAMKKGRISIAGSADPGTVSYRYTVRSSDSLSTAEGLIVVQASARVGQQAPTVLDTVLSARDRAELEGAGVDVVTDRVYWSTGDVSTLKLSIWGSKAEKYTVTGNRISGKYQAAGDTVPFKLSGTDVTGKVVDSYGFLVIPPLDELRLTLQPGFAMIKVDEDKSREIALSDLVDLGPGDTAEFKPGEAPTQRGQAVCTATANTLSYSAGKEAPWVDTCLVSVKLTEQKTWTELSVPVQIVPKEPIVELDPLTRTVSPGATEKIDLKDMVRWEGDREGRLGDLQFNAGTGGSNFEVSASGAQVTVQAKANAVPGSEDLVTVSVTGAGQSQAILTLRAGEAAKDTPRGATIDLNCTVGSSCQAKLIGAAGEYDPFEGKTGGGLKLDAIDSADCVAYGTLQLAGDNVSVAWPRGANGAGGTCTATFTVRDAQNRIGSGTIELDAQGVPRAPSSVTPTYADNDSVKLTVELTGAKSHPETTGVELVTESGRKAGSCELNGSTAICSVTGLSPSVQHTYFARAINKVGASEQTKNGATTWSYVPPSVPTISAAPVAWKENTQPGTGRVQVQLGSSNAGNVRLFRNDELVSRTEKDIYEVPAGQQQTYSVVVADNLELLPPGYVGDTDSSTGSTRVTAIGAPRAADSVKLETVGTKANGWKFDTSRFNANGGDALKFTFGIDASAAAVTCEGSTQSGNGLPLNEFYYGAVCASNDYGRTGAVVTNPITTGVQLAQVNGTYTVDKTPAWPTSKVASWEPVLDKEKAISWTASLESGLTPTYTRPTIDKPTSTDVVQCPTGTAGQLHCSPAGELKPASLFPFELAYSRSGCVPWASYDVQPSQATMAAAFTTRGTAGGNLVYALDPAAPRDIIVSWANGARNAARFSGMACAQPAQPDPDPEPDADAGSDTDGAADGS